MTATSRLFIGLAIVLTGCSATRTPTSDGGVALDAGIQCPVDAGPLDGYCSANCNLEILCSCADGAGPSAQCPVDGTQACEVLCASHGGVTVTVDAGTATDAGPSNQCSDGMAPDGGPILSDGGYVLYVNCSAGEICGLDGGCAVPDYDLTDAGLVLDRVTGLVWQRDLGSAPCGSPGACSQSGAQSYCRSIGMRLPTQAELYSLVDMGHMPTVDPSFFSDDPNDNWLVSSDAYPDGFGGTWVVDFDYGTSGYDDSVNWVRCVH